MFQVRDLHSTLPAGHGTGVLQYYRDLQGDVQKEEEVNQRRGQRERTFRRVD